MNKIKINMDENADTLSYCLSLATPSFFLSLSPSHTLNNSLSFSKAYPYSHPLTHLKSLPLPKYQHHEYI